MKKTFKVGAAWIAGVLAGAATLLAATEIERSIGLLNSNFTALLLWFDVKTALGWGVLVGLVSIPFLVRDPVPAPKCYLALGILYCLSLGAVCVFVLPQDGGKLPSRFLLTAAPLVFLSMPTSWVMIKLNSKMKESALWKRQVERLSP